MGSFKLSSDASFHFELVRNIVHVPYHGSDVNEILHVANSLVPGDFESFYSEFSALAERTLAHAEKSTPSTASGKVSAREAYFRASTYYRAADFYLHGNAADPRIEQLWEKQTACFNAAIALLPIPGQRHTLHADDFDIPIVFYSAAAKPEAQNGPRPTIILGNGFDGAQEEMLHTGGFAALRRGWNVVTYEGPGQPSVRRAPQYRGFIPDWERVVTPVVDWLFAHAKDLEIDTGKLGLWGESMGGYLAPRAAAFEHRLAAVFAVDGIYDTYAAFIKITGAKGVALFEAGNAEEFNTYIREWIRGPDAPTVARWGVSHGLWSLSDGAPDSFYDSKEPITPYDFFSKMRRFSLEDVVDKIQCPVLVADAESDLFFKGQPEELASKLGRKGEWTEFKNVDGAGEHCHSGAGLLRAQVVFDWFQNTVIGD
ncbi:MAG: hypothetical protein M1822_006662 [Bathelium mastoideum]|nr:MAG: hypothetical protein M1822_006662 [Bathelium mastoideum]